MAIILNIFVTACQDRYALMCGLKEYFTIHQNSSALVIRGIRRHLPGELITDTLKLLCVRLNFIGPWLKSLWYSYACCFLAYQENTNNSSRIPPQQILN